MKKTEPSRINTLMITVGTRQVGWRCQDGTVRCMGADGDRGSPPHIDELYHELKIDRGHHPEGDRQYPWSVRDLGKRYYEHGTAWLGGDFSAVELLIDHQIIADSATRGLQHIILWATDQPETVPWNYRRADTLWLAKLMQGKIQTTWPQIEVEVLHPQVNANDREAIRLELEGFILPLALEALDLSSDDPPVLAIQNKGAAPAIAEGLEICAAALVRQLQVVNVSPIEPIPNYENHPSRSAKTATEYTLVPVSDYFWPLERQQVISAWERGDFRAAQIWLQAHQSRHKVLYQLAGYLAIATNWEIPGFLLNKNFETGWLRSNALQTLARDEQIAAWRERLLQTRQDEVAQTWETLFLVEVQLRQENYTTAFIQFIQMVERLLYLRAQQEDWFGQGLIQVPDYWDLRRGSYNPSFFDLIKGWREQNRIAETDKWYTLLDTIRNKRNDTIHKAKPVTLAELRSLWTKNDFPNSGQEAIALFLDVLKKISRPDWQIPNPPLLRSLADWGLSVLQAEMNSF